MANETPVAVYLFEFVNAADESSLGKHNYHLYPTKLARAVHDEPSLLVFQTLAAGAEKRDWNHWSSFDDTSKWKVVVVTDRDHYEFFLQRVTFLNGAYWMSFGDNQGYIVSGMYDWMGGISVTGNPDSGPRDADAP